MSTKPRTKMSLLWRFKYSRYNPYNLKYLIRYHEWDIKFNRILRRPFMWIRYYLFNYIKYLIKNNLLGKKLRNRRELRRDLREFRRRHRKSKRDMRRRFRKLKRERIRKLRALRY